MYKLQEKYNKRNLFCLDKGKTKNTKTIVLDIPIKMNSFLRWRN